MATKMAGGAARDEGGTHRHTLSAATTTTTSSTLSFHSQPESESDDGNGGRASVKLEAVASNGNPAGSWFPIP